MKLRLINSGQNPLAMKLHSLLVGAALLCSCLPSAKTATIAVELRKWPDPANLLVNVGDTVVWIGGQTLETYGGEWNYASDGQGSISNTFDRPGVYLYRNAGLGIGDAGSIQVMPWTNRPPVITINTPVEDYYFNLGAPFKILASVEKPESEVSQVEFFADGLPLGIATNAPYQIEVETGFNRFEVRSYVLTAKLTDKVGGAALSQPVKINMADFYAFQVSHLRLLPNNRGVFFDYCNSGGRRYCVEYSNDLVHWYTFANVVNYGSLVDERAFESPMRFYRVVACP
ncbi:MAG: Ig-like domain-containing protein [Verrucomicrobiota bacterium]